MRLLVLLLDLTSNTNGSLAPKRQTSPCLIQLVISHKTAGTLFFFASKTKDSSPTKPDLSRIKPHGGFISGEPDSNKSRFKFHLLMYLKTIPSPKQRQTYSKKL